MKEYKGVVENITHSIVVGGKTYTTPVYDVEYTCRFSNGKFNHLMCDKHEGLLIIPHEYPGGELCTGQDFNKIINQAYPNKELMHLVCERFFRQYNKSDAWGIPRVLRMCGFVIHSTIIKEYKLGQILSEYQYYFFDCGDPILKLTHDCKDELIGRYVYLIRRK